MSLHILQRNYIVRSLLGSYMSGNDIEEDIRRFTFLFYTSFQIAYFFVLLLSASILSSGNSIVIVALGVNFFLNITAFILTYHRKNVYVYYLYLNLLWCFIHNSQISTTATHIIGLFVFLTIWSMLALLLLGKNHFIATILLCGVIFFSDLYQELMKSPEAFNQLFDTPNKFSHYVMPVILYGPFYLIILMTISFYYFLVKLQKRIKDKILIRQQRTNNKIQLLNKKLKEYSYYHSHELRAPVTKILGLCDLIKAIQTDEPKLLNLEELENFNANIKKAALDIDVIIKDMNDKLEKA